MPLEQAILASSCDGAFGIQMVAVDSFKTSAILNSPAGIQANRLRIIG